MRIWLRHRYLSILRYGGLALMVYGVYGLMKWAAPLRIERVSYCPARAEGMRDKRRPEEVLKEAYGVVLVKDEKMFNGEWRRQSRRKVGFIEVAKKLADERRLPGYDPKR